MSRTSKNRTISKIKLIKNFTDHSDHAKPKKISDNYIPVLVSVFFLFSLAISFLFNFASFLTLS